MVNQPSQVIHRSKGPPTYTGVSSHRLVVLRYYRLMTAVSESQSQKLWDPGEHKLEEMISLDREFCVDQRLQTLIMREALRTLGRVIER
jgi:hypothetical protein